MIAKTAIAAFVAVVLATNLQVVAKDGGVPTIDLEKRCRQSQRTTEQTVGSPLPDAFAVCMRTEQAARELLVKVWDTVPASVKAQCAQPSAYSPSYVEWVTCGEMERDVRKLRQEQPVSARTDNLCPIVLFEQDGSITSVNACPVPTKLLY
jgi:hypothetical protein